MRDVNKTQKLLESLSPKPLPPELREKILSTAYQKQRTFQVIAPVLRIVFSVCCLLLVLTLVIDIMIKNIENERLKTIKDVSQASEAIIEKDLQELISELFKIEYDQSLNQWLVRHYKMEKKQVKLISYQSIIDKLRE